MDQNIVIPVENVSPSIQSDIQVNRVSIYKRLKPETSKLKRERIKQNLELEFTYTDSSQSNDCDVQQQQQPQQQQQDQLLQEPEEKIKLIERAIGYFNADKDEANQKNDLNLSIEIGPPFVCQLCQSWFYLGSKLKVHYILNHSYYHCEICSILFVNFDDKQQHQSKYHTPIFCEICQQNFNQSDSLLDHYELVHDSTTCKFCGLLVQPKSLMQQHLSKKHQIHSKYLQFETDDVVDDRSDNFIEVAENTTDFSCKLCMKKRMIEVMFGHMYSFHKMALTSLMNLLVKNNAGIKCDGSSQDVIKCAKEVPELDKTKQDTYSKYFCSMCGLKYLKKIPEKFHLIYCQNKFPCKFCDKVLANSSSLDRHVQKVHTKFPCQQGCQKVSFTSEENLVKHYGKVHETVPCRYCDRNLTRDTVATEDHLRHEHKYKAQMMKNFKDSLYEIMDKDNKHIVVCCLCDENITLLTEQPKNVFLHYKRIHQMSLNRILQLCSPRPILEEYEQLYREINEQIKKENDNGESTEEDQEETVDKLVSRKSTTTANGDDGVKIKVEQPDSGGEEETEADEEEQEVEEEFEVKTEESEEYGTKNGCSLDVDDEEAEEEEEEEEEEKLKDFSHLESEIESDFDTEETEAFLNSDFEQDAEQFCELCSEEFETMFDLLKHLSEKHKLKMNLNKFECCYCKEKQLSLVQYFRHVFDVHKLENVPNENEHNQQRNDVVNVFKCCVCDETVLNTLNRCHIIEKHLSELDRFDLNVFGLKCRFCDDRFWLKDEINAHEVDVHYKEENKNSFHKCNTCSKVFSSQNCLKNHFLQEHPTESQFFNLFFKCLPCNVTYPSIDTLRMHFRSFHPYMKIYKCPVPQCYKTTKRSRNIAKHLKSPHNFKERKGGASRTCDICKKEFRTFRAASIHKLMKHERKIYAGFQCRICQEKFQTMEQRKLHYSTAHPGQLAYTCLECGKGFISKSGLYGHKKIHQEHETLTCPYCNKEFTRRDSYNEHLLIHIGPRHQCPHCPKSFTQRSNLTRHVRIHTGAKPYQCSYCDKRFSDKGACRSHERVHTKEEHCECSYCGKKFTKKQKLKYHIKFHTGEGLVNCEVCNKQFSNSYSLNEHRRIHNQETLVMCNCGRGFTSEKYLQRHITNVHSDSQAKYVCPICFKTLLHKSSYNDHIMTHTSVKHIKCMLCNQEYNTKKTVKRHLLDKHNIEVSGGEVNKYIYQLKPEDVGLNVPSASEMEINVNDLLSDKNLVSIDLTHLQKLETFKNKPKITNPGKRAKMKEAFIANTLSSLTTSVQIKEEPKSDGDDDDDENSNSESDEDLVLKERQKRKVVKPRKYKRTSDESCEEIQDNSKVIINTI